MKTIVTILWGDTVYDESNVMDIINGVKKRSKGEYRFVCVTDREEIPGAEVIPFTPLFDGPWWNKMVLFDKMSTFDECLYIDLDCLVTGDVGELFDHIQDEDITMVSFKSSNHESGFRRFDFFNSSVMGWKGHQMRWVWEEFVCNKDLAMRSFDADDSYLSNGLAFRDTFPDHLITSFFHGCTDRLHPCYGKEFALDGELIVLFNMHKKRQKKDLYRWAKIYPWMNHYLS